IMRYCGRPRTLKRITREGWLWLTHSNCLPPLQSCARQPDCGHTTIMNGSTWELRLIALAIKRAQSTPYADQSAWRRSFRSHIGSWATCYSDRETTTQLFKK